MDVQLQVDLGAVLCQFGLCGVSQLFAESKSAVCAVHHAGYYLWRPNYIHGDSSMGGEAAAESFG